MLWPTSQWSHGHPDSQLRGPPTCSLRASKCNEMPHNMASWPARATGSGEEFPCPASCPGHSCAQLHTAAQLHRSVHMSGQVDDEPDLSRKSEGHCPGVQPQAGHQSGRQTKISDYERCLLGLVALGRQGIPCCWQPCVLARPGKVGEGLDICQCGRAAPQPSLLQPPAEQYTCRREQMGAGAGDQTISGCTWGRNRTVSSYMSQSSLYLAAVTMVAAPAAAAAGGCSVCRCALQMGSRDSIWVGGYG